MLRVVTEKLLSGESLGFEQSYESLCNILQGGCSEVAVAGFLTAMAAKGEQASEIAGMARALREHAVAVRCVSERVVDVVGTGGDGRSTFNISTAAALVAAGAGVAVAKHGNRAITSKCGSADVLAELGVNLEASPEVTARCIDEAGMGFMFAPRYHPTMRYVQPVRKALGFRTVFNVLGPLANPAAVQYMMVGVAKPYLLGVMAEALKLLGIRRAFIVHGAGSDEVSVCGPTDMVELNEGVISSHTIDYNDYGINKASWADVAGGTVQENADMIREILAGKLAGPRRDVVVLNAAVAVMLAGKAGGILEGVEMARESIDSGKAAGVLSRLVKISND